MVNVFVTFLKFFYFSAFLKRFFYFSNIFFYTYVPYKDTTQYGYGRICYWFCKLVELVFAAATKITSTKMWNENVGRFKLMFSRVTFVRIFEYRK